MTQLFTEEGRVVPVTVLQAGPCKVIQVKTPEKDQYSAVQISFGNKKRAEFRMENSELKIEKGREIKVSDFTPGQVIDISGISKGRGFAGAMKRHGFHGAPASHGHDHPRAVGSIGQRFPQHVRPGLRMAGHMGAQNATVKHSVVVAVDPAKNLLFAKGGVPGHFGSIVKIVATGKKKAIADVFEYQAKA
ncbi:MAG: 50S ribosomal protein L3 [Candidatus Doudnabacteria bacterium]|nr:50S ribosomal protein L3 [bacterium]MDZ4244147.1 50S ribosomal protein L3 [Candidatus Doudnabacteria bacterium]